MMPPEADMYDEWGTIDRSIPDEPVTVPGNAGEESLCSKKQSGSKPN